MQSRYSKKAQSDLNLQFCRQFMQYRLYFADFCRTGGIINANPLISMEKRLNRALLKPMKAQTRLFFTLHIPY